MQEEHFSSIYYTIPAQVFEDKRLSSGAILLYALLSALTREGGYCHVSNSNLGKRLKISLTQIKLHLSELEKFGYINRIVSEKNERVIYVRHPIV